MARQIRFIEPIDSISGDLGQKQKLLYAQRNNSAWDAPRNVRNSARNYKTTYVGLYRKNSGKKYFAVRKRSTFHSTPAAIKNMALMGAANACAVIIQGNLSILTQLNTLYAQYRAQGGGYNFRQWIVMHIQPEIEANDWNLVISAGGTTVNCGINPFTGASDSLDISDNIFVKFGEVINPSFYPFFVNDVKALSMMDGGMPPFVQWIPNNRLNTLNLSTETTAGTTYVKQGSMYLLDGDGHYVTAGQSISVASRYTTTSVAPYN